MNKLIKYLVVPLINFYQIFLSLDRGILMFLAPGGACKYSLSCSEYSKRAFIRYGLVKGFKLSFRRFLSCR